VYSDNRAREQMEREKEAKRKSKERARAWQERLNNL